MKGSRILLLAVVALTAIGGGTALYYVALRSPEVEESTENPSGFGIYLIDGDRRPTSRDEIKLSGSPDLTGKLVSEAWAALGSQNDWSVMVDFSQEGRTKLRDLTGQNIGKRLAMVVDGVVLDTPMIFGRLEGTIAISGPFSEAEARSLVATITNKDNKSE